MFRGMEIQVIPVSHLPPEGPAREMEELRDLLLAQSWGWGAAFPGQRS